MNGDNQGIGVEAAGNPPPEALLHACAAADGFRDECGEQGCQCHASVREIGEPDSRNKYDKCGFRVNASVEVPGTSRPMDVDFSQAALIGGDCIHVSRCIGSTKVTDDIVQYVDGGMEMAEFGRRVAQRYLADHRAEFEIKAA